MTRLTRRDFCKSSALALPTGMQAAKHLLLSSTSVETGGAAEILDKDVQLQRFHFWQNRDWDWYKQNIPFFESPDAELDEVYYYRWEVVTRHLRYTSPETGYVFTEFLPVKGISWAGRYEAICASADLQLDEVRWLKDTSPARDYLRYFLTVPGAEPRAYGFAPTWAGAAMARVHGGSHVLSDLLHAAVENYQGWERGRVQYPNDNGFDPERGLFWNTGRDMGAEYNLASAQLSDTLRGIAGYSIRGGAGYRPDINAVMIAEAAAIAELSRDLGQAEIADEYLAKAASLKHNLQQQLWDPQREFFLHRWRYDEYAEGDTAGHRSIRAGSFIWETNEVRTGIGYQPQQSGEGKGRELFCYHLWRYGIPDDNDDSDAAAGYARAWRFLTSKEHFAGQFGPTTGERDDPWFSVIYGECRFNGQTWPFHTARVLAGGANLLNDYKHHSFFSREDWYSIFRTYAAMHRNANQPFIAESHDPDRPQWTELRPIGFHYFHSSFVDLVITGLVGLRPRRDDVLELNPLIPRDWKFFALDDVLYHGHRMSIVWDETGTRYGRGKGLRVIVDGRLLAHSDTCSRIEARLPAAEGVAIKGAPRERNFAVNAEGAAFPKASASHEGAEESAGEAIDGACWFDVEPANRWTSRGSDSSTEWFEVAFEEERTLHRVNLYFYEDDYGVEAPLRVRVESWTGAVWASVARSEAPRARCATCIAFEPTRTMRVRAVITNRSGCCCGLAQLEAWGYV